MFNNEINIGYFIDKTYSVKTGNEGILPKTGIEKRVRGLLSVLFTNKQFLYKPSQNEDRSFNFSPA